MSWVPLLDLDDLDGVPREVARSGQDQYGQLLDTWRALFHRPTIFESYLPFLRSVAGPGTVPLRTKDLTALVVAAHNGCRYTMAHRATSAKRNGVPEDEVVAAVSGEWHVFDAPLRDALTYAAALTTEPTTRSWSEAPTLIDSDLRARLEAALDGPQLVELTMSIAVWNALSRFHRVMGFDLDMPAPPARIDPAHRSVTSVPTTPAPTAKDPM